LIVSGGLFGRVLFADSFHCFFFCVSLLSFCLAKNESSKEKGEFWQTAPHAKTGLTLLTPFAYRRHALKLLPLLGIIMLLYAWQPIATILLLFSLLRQQLRRDHGLSVSALIVFSRSYLETGLKNKSNF